MSGKYRAGRLVWRFDHVADLVATEGIDGVIAHAEDTGQVFEWIDSLVIDEVEIASWLEQIVIPSTGPYPYRGFLAISPTFGFRSFGGTTASPATTVALLFQNADEPDALVLPTGSTGVIAWSSSDGAPQALAGTSLQRLRIKSDESDAEFYDPVTYQASPADPTGTTSGTDVMMGLAGAITPTSSRIHLVISGTLANTGSGNTVGVQMRYGTGSAPTNGAAATGTAIGTKQDHTIATGNRDYGFSLNAIVTGLTPATAYWLDITLNASGGTSTAKDIGVSAFDL